MEPLGLQFPHQDPEAKVTFYLCQAAAITATALRPSMSGR